MDVTVSNCTIDGAASGTKYTGGICGYNEGSIDVKEYSYEYASTVSGEVRGKASGESYTGGFCGYNKGTIGGKGSVDITLSGSDDADGYYGYVIGKNGSGSSVSVSTEITTNAHETVLDTGVIEVDELCRYTITLTRTSLVSVTFTDTDKNIAAVDGYFTTQAVIERKNLTPGTALIYKDDIKNKSETAKMYLDKGTYYLYLTENYVGKNTGCSAKVVID